jgi:hypothetical protein
MTPPLTTLTVGHDAPLTVRSLASPPPTLPRQCSKPHFHNGRRSAGPETLTLAFHADAKKAKITAPLYQLRAAKYYLSILQLKICDVN